MNQQATGCAPEGVWTALVTPFRDDAEASVDYDALRELIERQLDAGVSALVPCGTTGESPTLSHSEHDAVIEFVVGCVARRVPVVAGTGSNSTAEALRLTRHAALAGADAALVVCPYYNRPSPRMLESHFARIADEGELPVVLYNVPARTGVDLLPETVARLHDGHPNIVAVKEASGSALRAAELRDRCDIRVFSGDDALTLAMMAYGAVGVISVASNLVPEAVVRLVDRALVGDFAAAGASHAELHRLFNVLFCEPNPVPVKCAMRLNGQGNGVVREPLLPATEETEAALAALLDRLATQI